MCARYGLHDFHRAALRGGRWHVAGLGYSNPTPFDTPGEYSEAQLAERLEPFAELRSAGAGVPCAALWHGARPGPPGAARGLDGGARVHRQAPAGVLLLRPHPRGGGRRGARWGSTRARNVGKKGYLLELNRILHDPRRTGTRISAPPRPGPGRAEVSLTLPHRRQKLAESEEQIAAPGFLEPAGEEPEGDAGPQAAGRGDGQRRAHPRHDRRPGHAVRTGARGRRRERRHRARAEAVRGDAGAAGNGDAAVGRERRAQRHRDHPPGRGRHREPGLGRDAAAHVPALGGARGLSRR